MRREGLTFLQAANKPAQTCGAILCTVGAVDGCRGRRRQRAVRRSTHAKEHHHRPRPGRGRRSARGVRAGAWHHRHDPARMAELVTERVDDALDDVDATPEQRQRIHAVKDRMLARAKELHGDRAEGRAVILEAWKSDAPDAAKLHALVDERADAMRKLAHEAVDAGDRGARDPHARAAREARGEGRAADAPLGPMQVTWMLGFRRQASGLRERTREQGVFPEARGPRPEVEAVNRPALPPGPGRDRPSG